MGHSFKVARNQLHFINFQNHLIYFYNLIESISLLKLLQKHADITGIVDCQQMAADVHDQSESIVNQGYASQLDHQIP